ncbi:MAG: hypothetical protein AAB874_05305, partial [Patescibacteria group bacterium]
MVKNTQNFVRLAKRKPHLASQLTSFFAAQGVRYREREAQNYPALTRILEWAKIYVEEFMLGRSDRAGDVVSREVTEARKLELDFIGPHTHHFLVACMDGRNMPAVMLSHVPHVGGVMRTQAGELFGFLESSAKKDVIIDRSSYTADLLKRLLLSKAGDTIYYSLDSHFGCAARGEIHTASGGMSKDGGLRADVRRKILIAKGIKTLARELELQGYKTATIFPQFFSYEPHDGTLTMGLELYPETVGRDGFTNEVIKKFTAEKRILSTWKFLHDPRVQKALSKLVSAADFRNNYPKTLHNNWQAISALYKGGKGEIFRVIFKELQYIYEHAGWNIGQDENLQENCIAIHSLEHKTKI